MPRFIWLCLFGLLFAHVQAAEPVAPVGLHVMHGTFANAKFWFRLQVPDKQFGVNRVCELVYTPPSASDLGGTQMSDCPFLLARLVSLLGMAATSVRKSCLPLPMATKSPTNATLALGKNAK